MFLVILLIIAAVKKGGTSIITNRVLQVCSLSTIMREYVALHSVASLPFKDLILSASENLNVGSSDDRGWNVPRPLMDYLKDYLNDSQLDAIHVSPAIKSACYAVL